MLKLGKSHVWRFVSRIMKGDGPKTAGRPLWAYHEHHGLTLIHHLREHGRRFAPHAGAAFSPPFTTDPKGYCVSELNSMMAMLTTAAERDGLVANADSTETAVQIAVDYYKEKGLFDGKRYVDGRESHTLMIDGYDFYNVLFITPRFGAWGIPNIGVDSKAMGEYRYYIRNPEDLVRVNLP